MIKGAAFDGSMVNSEHHKFSNLAKTAHNVHLETDYEMMRDDGFTFFRDTCWLDYSFNWSGPDWSYLDRLAKVSKGEIQLSISHYEWPKYMMSFLEFCEQLAKRYKYIFHSYIPAVETGYWAVECGVWKGWNPDYDNWWKAYTDIIYMAIGAAKALKNGDPYCSIAMAEPWGMAGMPYEDQARPFNNMMGKFDKVAFDNKCYVSSDGYPDLLDIVGLNIYDPFNCNEAICKAREMFPGKEIMITETSNVHHQHIPPAEWWAILERETNLSGAEIVCWAPAIQMYANTGGDIGKPIGGYLYDLSRRKHF